MYEEPSTTPYVPPQLPAAKKNRKALKITGLILLIVALLGSAGYGVYAWQQNAQLQSSVKSEQDKSASLNTENTELKKQLESSTALQTIVDALPNNKTATYPNTEANRNILWWNASTEKDKQNLVVLSHKEYQDFLSGINPTLITEMCGTTATPKSLLYNIPTGTYDTTTKKFTKSETKNCLDTLASAENKNETVRKQASTALTMINNEVAAFVESVEIK